MNRTAEGGPGPAGALQVSGERGGRPEPPTFSRRWT